MPGPDIAKVNELLTQGPFRSEVGRKQLTLAFGGLYIASTTNTAKPFLVWEAEKGYPRYYIPIDSLHTEIRNSLDGAEPQTKTNGNKASTRLEHVETVEGKGNGSKAVVEQLTVGSKSMTWVRFVEGPWKGFIRFERNEIGTAIIS